MSNRIPTELATDLLGSARMFLSALVRVLEYQPLEQATHGEVTLGQLKLLELIALTERLSIGEVASFLRVTPAAASQSIDRLVQRRLLRRSGGARDRRTSHVALTRRGRRLIADVQTVRSRTLQLTLGRLTPPELRKTTELLDRLSREIRAFDVQGQEVCMECGTHFRERCVLRGLSRCTCFYERFGNQSGRNVSHRLARIV